MVGRVGKTVPGSREHFRQNQHGHVAANAIAYARNPAQNIEHFGVSLWTSVIKLDCIRPRRKIRVFAMSKGPPALFGFSLKESLAGGFRLRLNEQFRKSLDPGMINAQMIWDEIQNQFHA